MTAPDTQRLAYLADLLALVSDEDFEAYKVQVSNSLKGKATPADITAAISGLSAGGASGPAALPQVGRSRGNALPLYAYGHSFVSGVALTDPEYWTRLFAGAEALTHPTSDGGAANDLMRAVGGSGVTEILARVASGVPFAPGGHSIVALQVFMNSLRVAGNVPLHVTNGRNGLRAILSFLGAEQRVEETDPSIVYTGATVTANAVAAFSGTTGKGMTATGGTIDIPTPAGRDAYIHMAAKGAGQPGATLTITDRSNGDALVDTLDMSDQTTTQTSAYAWRVPPALRGHTLRMTRVGTAASTMYFDVMTVQAKNPPIVILMKEPYLADYTASTAFPNGSIEATDAFNAIIDEVAVDFPNVVVVNPNRPGYWDKTVHIGADKVHPNAEGHKALARAAFDAVEAYLVRRAAAVGITADALAADLARYQTQVSTSLGAKANVADVMPLRTWNATTKAWPAVNSDLPVMFLSVNDAAATPPDGQRVNFDLWIRHPDAAAL
jgi:hypothetical protein